MAKRKTAHRFWDWAEPVWRARDGDESAPQERTLYINGPIAENGTWFDDDVTPAAFKAELYGTDENTRTPITLWIDSPGGDVFAAAQIYNMLMDYKGDVTVKIGSIAASAASVIAMAGTKVLISPVGQFMIHNPSTRACGDSEEMRKAAEMLDSVKESIINSYEIKTGLPRLKISRLMDSVKFMDAHEAIALGFADGLLFEPQTADTELAAVFNRPADISKITTALSKGITPEIPAVQGKSVAEKYSRLNLILGGNHNE
jgi:ATP-dependent Clp protease protease subunit